MFTGLIQEIGVVKAIKTTQNGKQFTIHAPKTRGRVQLGASVAHNGVCLTITQFMGDNYTIWASPETLKLTNCDKWVVETQLNIEPSLRVGDELGGHWVMGHVDGLGKISQITKGEAWDMEVTFPPEYSHLVAQKGSIAIDGCSLTINRVQTNTLAVMIIPHTLDHTIIRHYQTGSAVNMEFDMMARYAQRLLQPQDK